MRSNRLTRTVRVLALCTAGLLAKDPFYGIHTDPFIFMIFI